MEKKATEKGTTLVEIIVSLAIIGIIAVSFLTVFAGMFKGIVKGGDRGEATFEAQQVVENKIANNDTGTTTSVAISHNGSTYYVNGEILLGEGTGGINTNVDVKVFVPFD